MEEIIKVNETALGQTVSAKDLYDFLGYNKSAWKRWNEKNIAKNKFAIEGVDWVGFNIVSNGNDTQDFEITLDFAKRLSMLSRTEKGEEIRRYFLRCEKKANEIKPMSQLEVLQFSVNHLIEQSKKIEAIEEKVKQIEAKQITSPVDFYSVAGFGSLNGYKVDITLASNLGRKATSICNELGYVMGVIPDPRFGRVKTYPTEVLQKVFDEYRKNFEKK
jgi:anti-repressor protein